MRYVPTLVAGFLFDLGGGFGPTWGQKPPNPSVLPVLSRRPQTLRIVRQLRSESIPNIGWTPISNATTRSGVYHYQDRQKRLVFPQTTGTCAVVEGWERRTAPNPDSDLASETLLQNGEHCKEGRQQQ